jgi:hypothetical protein
MAQQGRATLKAYFETGDVPTEAQFEDLIDSFATIAEVKGVFNINTQTGTSYELVVGDAGWYVRLDNADTVWVTVPPDTFTVNTVITLEQTGAGVVVMLEGLGVTINAYNSGYQSNGQFAIMQLVCTDTNVWTLVGGVAVTVEYPTTTEEITTTV